MSDGPLTVYLDGAYLPAGEARVSVDDRAFLFADGVYEVTKVQGTFIFVCAPLPAQKKRATNNAP